MKNTMKMMCSMSDRGKQMAKYSGMDNYRGTLQKMASCCRCVWGQWEPCHAVCHHMCTEAKQGVSTPLHGQWTSWGTGSGMLWASGADSSTISVVE